MDEKNKVPGEEALGQKHQMGSRGLQPSLVWEPAYCLSQKESSLTNLHHKIPTSFKNLNDQPGRTTFTDNYQSF